MPGYTTSFLFPDINVWIALTYASHVHHHVARNWLDELPEDVRLCFSRFTQLGFLRLLTSAPVMEEDVLTQQEAWRVYDRWLQDDRVRFVEEPPDLDRHFRSRTRLRQAAPKAWADAYLASFAEASQLTLVTFDRGFKGKVRPVVLLEETKDQESS